MLTRIETKEIMTSWEARNKYRDKYIRFIITEIVDRGDNDLGYVVYVYDKEREEFEIPKEGFKDIMFAALIGVAAEPFGQFERIIRHDN